MSILRKLSTARRVMATEGAAATMRAAINSLRQARPEFLSHPGMIPSMIPSLMPLWRPGSTRWLVAKELAYGGLTAGIPVGRVSPLDPRSRDQLETWQMRGGDRMSPTAHDYAPHYARHLRRFIGRKVTLVEVGILRGAGLAIWSDLFPDGRIIGLDIDLSHFRSSEGSLKRSGAFASNNVEAHEFDQFTCTEATLGSILRGASIDVFIDDGFHAEEPVLNTFKAVLPHLSDDCVCFIEDITTVAPQLSRSSPGFSVEQHGELTILSRP